MKRIVGVICIAGMFAMMAGCGQCGSTDSALQPVQKPATPVVKKQETPPPPPKPEVNYLRSDRGVFVINTQTWKTADTPATGDAELERFVISPDGAGTTIPRMTVTALHNHRVALADMAKDSSKTLWRLIERMRPDLQAQNLSPAQLKVTYTGKPKDYAAGRLVGIPMGDKLADLQLWLHMGNTSAVLITGLAGKGDDLELLDHMAFISRSIKWMPGYAHDGALPIAAANRTLRIPASFAPLRQKAGGKVAQWFAMAGCETRPPFAMHLQPMKQVVAGDDARVEDVSIWISASRRSDAPPEQTAKVDMESWFEDELTRLKALFSTGPVVTAAFGEDDSWGLLRFARKKGRRVRGPVIDIARIHSGDTTLCLIAETKGRGRLPKGYARMLQSMLGTEVKPTAMKAFK